MKKHRNKMVKVQALGADRALARLLNPNASDAAIDTLAAYRAVARSIARELKSTVEALNVITAEVPAQTLRVWAEGRLKAA